MMNPLYDEMAKLTAAFAAFDNANSQDPNTELVDGQAVAKELIYAQRMSQCLETFSPNSCEALQLAVRCQHIQRWNSPRTDYPEGRQGYLRWRSQLAKYHAQTAATLLTEVGYNDEIIAQVKQLLLKQKLKKNADVQTLEDVACLVFIKHYLEAFTHKHNEEKLIDIIQKTWRKMSDEGHQAALQLPLNTPLQDLIGKALNPDK